MKRAELVASLRAMGYTGSVSFPKAELDQLYTTEREKYRAANPSTDPSEARRRKDPYTHEMEWENLTPDRDFKVRGEPGWFRFLSYDTNPETEESWVSSIGGANGKVMYRCFSSSRINLKKTRQTQFQKTNDEEE